MRWLGLRALSKRHIGDNTEPIRVTPFESLKEAVESRKQKQEGKGGEQRLQDQLSHTHSPDRELGPNQGVPAAPQA